MQEAQQQPAETFAHPNRWPARIIAATMLLAASIWLAVWRGWLAPDWGCWALASGTLVTVITVAIWRETPGS